MGPGRISDEHRGNNIKTRNPPAACRGIYAQGVKMDYESEAFYCVPQEQERISDENDVDGDIPEDIDSQEIEYQSNHSDGGRNIEDDFGGWV
jgi:hypothetical protein